MHSQEAAEWMRKPNNMAKFLEAFNPDAFYKPHVYPVVLLFVPIEFNLGTTESLRELEEAAGCKEGDLISARWIKPPERRHSKQKSAHAKLFCATPEVANHFITSTVRIHNKVIGAKRDTWEPAVCNKCQAYGHFAARCEAEHVTCGRCAQQHSTDECESDNVFCTPCGSADHETNSEACPQYIRRWNATMQRSPENLQTLFPTEENWMCQDSEIIPIPSQMFATPLIDPDAVLQEQQSPASPRKPPRKGSHRHIATSVTNSGRPIPSNRRGTGSPQKRTRYFQQTLNFRNGNASQPISTTQSQRDLMSHLSSQTLNWGTSDPVPFPLSQFSSQGAPSQRVSGANGIPLGQNGAIHNQSQPL